VNSQSSQQDNGYARIRTKPLGQEVGRDVAYRQGIITDHDQRRCQLHGHIRGTDLMSFLVLESMEAEVVVQSGIPAVEMVTPIGLAEAADQ
jgi:hypothetical protein